MTLDYVESLRLLEVKTVKVICRSTILLHSDEFWTNQCIANVISESNITQSTIHPPTNLHRLKGTLNLEFFTMKIFFNNNTFFNSSTLLFKKSNDNPIFINIILRSFLAIYSQSPNTGNQHFILVPPPSRDTSG